MTSLRFLLLINSFDFFSLLEQLFIILVKLLRSLFVLSFSLPFFDKRRLFFNDGVILLITNLAIGVEVIPFISFIWSMDEAWCHATGVLFAVFMTLFDIENKDLINFLLSIQGICCNDISILFKSFGCDLFDGLLFLKVLFYWNRLGMWWLRNRFRCFGLWVIIETMLEAIDKIRSIIKLGRRLFITIIILLFSCLS